METEGQNKKNYGVSLPDRPFSFWDHDTVKILWQIVAGYSSINVTHDETILHGGVFSFSTHSVHCKRH